MARRVAAGKASNSRRWATVASLVAVVVASVTLTGTPAHAIAVVDGSDPNATGCANSAATEYSTQVPDTLNAGRLELRWSSGCETAWARFTCYVGGITGCSGYRLYVHRNNDGKEEAITVTGHTHLGDQLYTLQLNDGAFLSAKACLDDLFGTFCTGSF